MAKRILIGYESGEHGQGALELGCALASALGAELVVGHVYAWDTYLVPAPDDSPLEEWHALLRRDAESLVAEALSRCRTDTAPRGIAWASTSPARGLYELATSEEADYVVVGSSRRGPVGRVLIGSTGERLLQGAPCAVLVVPHTHGEPAGSGRPKGFATIGVAFDGLAESEAALELAQALASELGARLRVIWVLPPPSFAAAEGSIVLPAPADYGELAAAIETAARRRLKEVVTRLKASHEVEGELLTGDPARLLAGESERGLDLMVVGSRGYGPLRRVLLGAVSANLARTAACPVLVIPRVGSEVEEAEQPPAAADAR